MSEKQSTLSNLHQSLGNSHMNLLSTKKVLICLSALSLAYIISFSDQTGITVALPLIGKDLNAEQTINWAGTASMLANCVCQVLFGRFADIFGRKNVLLTCLVILCIGDVACSLAQTGIQFFIFRAIAGIGNGGISSLCMVILSDIVSLKNRGRYQGILGSSVGIGNSVGPFLMAGFADKYTWRAFYYTLAPLCLLVLVIIHFFVDGKPPLVEILSRKEKLMKIDYLGIVAATIGLTFLLVPISGGGSQFAWSSPIVISFFIIGGLFMGLFILIEWKFATLPMIPLGVLKNPSLALLISSNFLFGAAYYSFTYYLPYYFQIVKGKSSLHSAIFLLPLVISQALMSIVSGQIITFTGHYIYVVGFGYTLWLTSCCLLILWNEAISDSVCVVILLVMGTGVAFTFQPTMVAVQAQAKKADRAVVISMRNVVRSFGGAIGIAVGSMIISNTVLKEIRSTTIPIAHTFLDKMAANIFATIDETNLTKAQIGLVREMYVRGLRNYYYFLIPLIALCLVSSFFVKDSGLRCIDELEINGEVTQVTGRAEDRNTEKDDKVTDDVLTLREQLSSLHDLGIKTPRLNAISWSETCHEYGGKTPGLQSYGNSTLHSIVLNKV